jgi:hypothetical protein
LAGRDHAAAKFIVPFHDLLLFLGGPGIDPGLLAIDDN